MLLFFDLLVKTLPLYIIAALGFFGGRYLNLDNKTIATTAIYIVTPVIIFNGALNSELSINILIIPLISFMLFCLVTIIAYLGSRVFGKNREDSSILSFLSASGNVGYFGLPLALAVFGESVESEFVMLILGFQVYFATVGMYVLASSKFSLKESLNKVLRMPYIYAFVIGVFVNFLNFDLGVGYDSLITIFRGGYSLLGMMLVGLGIAKIKSVKVEWGFVVFALMVRHILWPLLLLFIVYIDSFYTKLFDTELRNIFILVSLVPSAAVAVAMSIDFDLKPEQTSITVLISTILAMFYIPLVLSILGIQI